MVGDQIVFFISICCDRGIINTTLLDSFDFFLYASWKCNGQATIRQNTCIRTFQMSTYYNIQTQKYAEHVT